MKKLITTGLVALVLATPLAAKQSRTFTEGDLAGYTFSYDEWKQSKCDTYPTTTKAQNRRLVQRCIGKMSKGEYTKKYYRFLEDYKKANDKRVLEVRKLGLLALSHPDIEWKSEKSQKLLNDGKIAASVIGSLIAAPIVAHVAAFSGILTVNLVGLAIGIAV